MAEHEHTPLPCRCCQEESPEDVLKKLQASPPKQRGKRKKNVLTGDVEWFNTEPDSAFKQRQEAWEMAVAREEAGCK